MKKTLLMTLLAGLVSASQLVQATEVFITGSTAFRKNVHDAVQKLFTSYSEIDDTNNILGQGAATGNGSTAWVIWGTPANSITNKISDTLVVHASFTGSLQGAFTVQQGLQIEWLGTNAGGTTLVTNSATLAFSDVFTSSSLFRPAQQLSGGYGGHPAVRHGKGAWHRDDHEQRHQRHLGTDAGALSSRPTSDFLLDRQ
jgi:hypothetical protein